MASTFTSLCSLKHQLYLENFIFFSLFYILIMNNIKTSVLYTQEQIQKRVSEMAQALSRDLKGKRVVVAGMLKGSFRFYCDLVRAMNIDMICDFYSASSYGLRNKPSTEVRMNLDVQVDLQDKHVILVEDIVDRGITLNSILSHLKARHPQSITVVALLIKLNQIQKKIKIDHIGFKIKGDPFVVGYGLDYREKFRNLPYIARIENLN